MSFSPIEIVAIVWGVVAILYSALLLYRSIVGMKEEDSLFLSAGEARLEAQQREVVKQLGKLDPYVRNAGIAALVMTVVLAGMWIYGVARNLL
jgi:hypothetical protein